MKTCPNSTSDLGLIRHVVSLSAVIFNPVLSAQDESDSVYLSVDTHSAAFLAQRLSSIAGIRCKRLNTSVPASEQIRTAAHVHTGTWTSHEYLDSGLYDVMFHIARAMIAASQRSFLSRQHTGATLAPHPTHHHPQDVYTRAITSLAHAFGQSREIIRAALGSIESCDDSALLHSDWLPDMQWEQRCAPYRGIELWPSTRDNRQRLEDQLDVLLDIPSSRPLIQDYPRAHLQSPPDSRTEGTCGSSTATLNYDMDEDEDDDAEGETDPEYAPRQPSISNGVAGPHSSSRGKQPVRKNKRRRSESDLSGDSTEMDMSRSPISHTHSAKKTRR